MKPTAYQMVSDSVERTNRYIGSAFLWDIDIDMVQQMIYDSACSEISEWRSEPYLKDAFANRIGFGGWRYAWSVGIIGEKHCKHTLGYRDKVHGTVVEPDIIFGFCLNFLCSIQLGHTHLFFSTDDILDVYVFAVCFRSIVDGFCFIGLNEEKQVPSFHFIGAVLQFAEVGIPNQLQSTDDRFTQKIIIV